MRRQNKCLKSSSNTEVKKQTSCFLLGSYAKTGSTQKVNPEVAFFSFLFVTIILHFCLFLFFCFLIFFFCFFLFLFIFLFFVCFLFSQFCFFFFFLELGLDAFLLSFFLSSFCFFCACKRCFLRAF